MSRANLTVFEWNDLRSY